MMLKDIIPSFMEYKQNFVKRSTISCYTDRLNTHILPFFGEMEFVSELLVQDFVIQKLNTGLKTTTICDLLIILKTILKYGKKRALIDFQEWKVEFPKEHREAKLEVYSISDHKKLFAHLKEQFSFRNLGIMVALSTGMRIGEVCGLKWKDINIEHGSIFVCRTVQRIGIGNGETEVIVDTPKSSSSNREIPLNGDLLKVVKPLLKIMNQDHFIISNSATPIEPGVYRVYFKRLTKAIGLPHLKFHGLRHTFATRCINNNVDIKTVSTILGHADVSITLNTYSHPDLAQKKTAIDKLLKAVS